MGTNYGHMRHLMRIKLTNHRNKAYCDVRHINTASACLKLSLSVYMYVFVCVCVLQEAYRWTATTTVQLVRIGLTF